MSRVVRKYEIRRRQRRHLALSRWKAKLAKATNFNQTEAILKKLAKIAPWISAKTWQDLVEAEKRAPLKEVA